MISLDSIESISSEQLILLLSSDVVVDNNNLPISDEELVDIVKSKTVTNYILNDRDRVDKIIKLRELGTLENRSIYGKWLMTKSTEEHSLVVKRLSESIYKFKVLNLFGDYNNVLKSLETINIKNYLDINRAIIKSISNLVKTGKLSYSVDSHIFVYLYDRSISILPLLEKEYREDLISRSEVLVTEGMLIEATNSNIVQRLVIALRKGAILDNNKSRLLYFKKVYRMYPRALDVLLRLNIQNKYKEEIRKITSTSKLFLWYILILILVVIAIYIAEYEEINSIISSIVNSFLIWNKTLIGSL